MHITYEKNVSVVREAEKNLTVGSTEVEAPKDILSNRTIPGYAAATIADTIKRLVKMIENLRQEIRHLKSGLW